MAMSAEAWKKWKVVALAGGVGGAKLAHGLAEVLPAGQLTVIVNVADDFVHYGLHISPDIDTVMYTLADLANPATGWGLVNETWQCFETLERYGEAMWFRLGDRDLATHMLRTQALASGQSLTTITRHLRTQLGVEHEILPATNERLATLVHTQEKGILPFQEYFVKYRWQPTVTRLEFDGSDTARITCEVRDALVAADVIIICPSNPLLSIAPILAISGIREALETRRIPCVAVSPLVGGKAIKGPADKLMGEMGLEVSNTGVARYYNGLIDWLVIDKQDDAEQVIGKVPGMSIFQTQTVMQTVADRQWLAHQILNHMN